MTTALRSNALFMLRLRRPARAVTHLRRTLSPAVLLAIGLSHQQFPPSSNGRFLPSSQTLPPHIGHRSGAIRTQTP
jgi:hypothetical protein